MLSGGIKVLKNGVWYVKAWIASSQKALLATTGHFRIMQQSRKKLSWKSYLLQKTQLTYGWIPKGKRKEVATTGRQKRLNFIGGICLNGHRFTYTQADTIDAYSICDFLWKLRKDNPG